MRSLYPRSLRRQTYLALAGVLTHGLLAITAYAQTPRLGSLFPAGARQGQTVEVQVNGGSLVGVRQVIIHGGPGVRGELVGGTVEVDASARPIFEKQCTTCHEARSPANRTLGAEQWAATVDRMIKVRGADIKTDDRDKIVAYLQSLARAGKLSVKFFVDKDAPIGMREVRLVSGSGISTPFNFEIGDLPEMPATTPNAKPEEAPTVTFPLLINGTIAQSGQRDYFRFEAKKGDRRVFNLKGYRLNPLSNQFFNPALYLYDAKGKQLAKSLGRFALDPLIDWTCPEEGTYSILVRDLLWKGNPASIYRLSMGELGYEASLSPLFARPGASFTGTMLTPLQPFPVPFSFDVPKEAAGVTIITTPMGDVSLLVRDVPAGGPPVRGLMEDSVTTALPAIFQGEITTETQKDVFKVNTDTAQSLEFYATRLGSNLRPTIVIKNQKGEKIRTVTAETSDDISMNNAFPSPGNYIVEVSGSEGTKGAYCWEATGAQADFALMVSPDTINLPRNSRVALLVRATKRQNLKVPIALRIDGLPKGVLVDAMSIPTDDDKAVLVLNTNENALPSGSMISVEGYSGGQMRRAQPYEIYRVNNQPRLMARRSQALAIVSSPHPFKLTAPENITTYTNEVKIKVAIERRPEFNGPVVLQVLGLPPGVRAPERIPIPAGADEATVTLKVDANAPFKDPKRLETQTHPQFVIVGMGGTIDQDDALPCTAYITLLEK